MSRHKNFDDDAESSVEPITFTLKGEEFTAIPEIQGKVLIDMIKRTKDGDPTESFEVMIDLFNAVLEEDSLTRFNALIEDKKRVVTMQKLANIVAYLIEQYAGENHPEAPRGA